MNLFNKFIAGAIALVAATGMTTAVLAVDISGAGATFPFPIYSKWASAYKGKPLYYFVMDSAAGEQKGEGRGMVWHMAKM